MPLDEALRSASEPAAPDLAYLSVRNIEKRFGELKVLQNVSLDAMEHEVVSMIGASGSGKSTLLRCINLLTIPDRGDI